jgi:hypothetical protein
MKKLLLSSMIATAAFASVANAGSISLDLRADANSTTYSEEVGKADFFKYYIQMGRVDYKNNLNEDTAFRLRYRFAGKSPANISARDSSNGELDLAYVTQKLGDNLMLTAGKYASDVGAFEGGSNGADLYFQSEAYGGTSYINGGDDLTGFGTELYYTGAKLAFTFADQEINIQTANNDLAVGRNVTTGGTTPTSGDQSSTEGFNQNKTMSAIVYKGMYLDKMLAVIASYHFEKISEEREASYVAAGFQFKNESWLASIEYFMNTFKGDVAGTADITDTLSDVVATVKYSMGSFTPIAKISSAEEKIDAGATNKYLSWGVALEYKPVTDAIYRYHVAYNNRTVDSDDTAFDGANVQEVVAGVRILADFLK